MDTTNPNLDLIFEKIRHERTKQVAKGFDHAHDDKHTSYQLIEAGIAHAMNALPMSEAKDYWPFEKGITEYRHSADRLVVAVSFLVAELERLMRGWDGRFEGESILGGPDLQLLPTKAEAIGRILAVAEECAEENWDGYGAYPVHPGAAERAVRLVQTIPEGGWLPEPGADPNGCISLEWYVSPSHLLTMSMEATGDFSYAWMSGLEDHGYGVAKDVGEFFPTEITDILSKLSPDRWVRAL